MSWLIVPNALSTSIKIMQVIKASPETSNVVAFKKERHVSIKYFFCNRIHSHIRSY